jgi:hypothetical protein
LLNKNIKINNLLINIFSFGLILLSIVQVAKSTILNVNNFNNIDINPWAFADLYINYQGGFVRRGLIGEIVFQLDSDGILFDSFYKLIFVNFCIFIILMFLNIRLANLNNLQHLIFHLSIFSVFYMGFFGHYYARKEIFILNLFLILTALYRKINFKLFFYSALILSAVSILIHEGIGFFIFFPFVSYLIGTKSNTTQLIKYFRASNLIIFLIISLNKGSSPIVQQILSSLSKEDLILIGDLSPNAISALGWGIRDAFEYLYVVIFSGSIMLWSVFLFFIPYSISIIFGDSFYEILYKIKTVILERKEFILLPILFILGWDWGRWILVIFYFLFFSFLTELKVSNKYTIKLMKFLPFIIISLLTSMPPCCLEMGSTKVSSNFYRIYKSLEITILQILN